MMNAIYNMQQETELNRLVILKNFELDPKQLTIDSKSTITIKVSRNNTNSFSSNLHENRKFIFMIEENDEETPALTEGQHYTFKEEFKTGETYTLQCINYPKLRMTIQVESAQEILVEKQVERPRPLSPLMSLTSVEEEKDQDQKEFIECSPFGQKNNSKSDIADYDRMLSEEDLDYDFMPNKYLKYFKEQFKLWKDFFQGESKQQDSGKKNQTNRSETNDKNARSSGSVSNFERKSQKQKSAHLYSQQQISDIHEEDLSGKKIMKKTNSEYGFNIDRERQQNDVKSTAQKKISKKIGLLSSGHKKDNIEVDSFVNWAIAWANENNHSSVVVKSKGDKYLVSQWMQFLHNSNYMGMVEFKLTQFMFG